MKNYEHSAALESAAGMLRSSSYLVVLTGAGISTPSGIPDFRSAGSGSWKSNDPMQVASLTSFQQNPEVFYRWLNPLARCIFESQPNPAHQALAELSHVGIVKTVITQNIDSLHQRAGTPRVVELHGSLRTLSCPSCRKTFPSEDFFKAWLQKLTLPACPVCCRIMKPDLVLFEENLPQEAWETACQESARADVILVAGSSLTVHPACSLPEIALRSGAKLILINFTPTPLDHCADIIITQDVAVSLPVIAGLCRI